MTMRPIFEVTSEEDFTALAVETFRYQYENTEVYRRFTDYLKIYPAAVRTIEDIPYLPIESFKKHIVLHKDYEPAFYFQSSGTADITVRSRHYLADTQFYRESILRCFENFFGKASDYIFLGLLPNYSENPHSSLIYMVDFLMSQSQSSEHGYYLDDFEKLFLQLQSYTCKKVILFGVSFALLDFLDYLGPARQNQLPKNLIVLETGGMKGRKKEMTKDELLYILQQGFGTRNIYSEYSMTELLSQAYALRDNQYQTPPWMRILIRNTDNPLQYLPPGRTGGINIVDLANQYSCSFIATQDLGKLVPIDDSSNTALHPRFEVLGRINQADLRGCSMLVS